MASLIRRVVPAGPAFVVPSISAKGLKGSGSAKSTRALAFGAVVALLACLTTGGVSLGQDKNVKHVSKAGSDTFDINKVTGFAVYQYSKCYSEMSEGEIDFKFTKRKVEEVTRGFVSPIVGQNDLGTVPSAYVYMMDSDGHVEKGKVVADWDYVVVGNTWSRLYPLTPTGKAILKSHLKKCDGEHKNR